MKYLLKLDCSSSGQDLSPKSHVPCQQQQQLQPKKNGLHHLPTPILPLDTHLGENPAMGAERESLSSAVGSLVGSHLSRSSGLEGCQGISPALFQV